MRRTKASCCVRAIGGGVRRPAAPVKPPVRPGAGEQPATYPAAVELPTMPADDVEAFLVPIGKPK